MSYAISEEHETPRITPAVQWLIGTNVLIYFLQLTVVSPADMQGALGFEVRDLPGGWWKALTYMFVHGGFLHLAGNMYMLWLFGPRIEHRWSPGAFARFYLLCGIGAWATYLLFSRDGGLIGASGAVYGVMVAYAMMYPDAELYFFPLPLRVKVKWLVGAYVLYDLVMWQLGQTSTTGTAYLAHVGGAVTGWFYMRTRTAPTLDQLRQRISPVPDVPDETPRAVPRSLPRPRERESDIDEIVAKSKAIVGKQKQQKLQPARALPRQASEVKASEVDRVLDKISAEGMDSLTDAERAVLAEFSRRLRGR